MKKADFATDGGRALADLARELGGKQAPQGTNIKTTEIQNGEKLKFTDD